jgi:formylglycine-generating enzyme
MPSCGTGTDGVTTCGAAASGTESCCTSPAIAGGTFFRTYTYGNTSSYANSATVSGFRLDKYLVTVGRFRQYVDYMTGAASTPPATGSGIHSHLNGGKGLANSGSPGTYEIGWSAAAWNGLVDPVTHLPNLATGSGAASAWNTNLACEPSYATWTPAAGTNENLPINCVNWYEAYAFCIWDGGFLPSEAEWEYAAAGGSQQRQYPWGSTAPGMANQYAIYGDGEAACYFPSGTAASCTGVANFAPVGTASKGAGVWGQLDLVGELFEWNLDWYAPYAACADCADLKATSNRVMRGDLLNNASTLVPSSRFDVDPSFRVANLGFRCARPPAGTPAGPSTGSTTGTTTGSAADGGTTPGMNVPVVVPAGCTVPSPVSFQKDIQIPLNASCGRSGGANASNGGCHVLDSDSTMWEGGKNHAFDWITGTAHASSCPQTPTPLRFQVVMATMQQANPPTCSASRQMPVATTPAHPPLTGCQLATLQSWLNEPYVAQFHRYDGISPTMPYAMPPWN